MQSSFFDLEDRHHKLNERDHLVELTKLVDWRDVRATLSKVRTKSRKSNAGRKPFDALTMFKTLVLQSLYSLSDDALGFQIKNSYSFYRFLGATPEGKTPDAKTTWPIREQFVTAGRMETLSLDFDL